MPIPVFVTILRSRSASGNNAAGTLMAAIRTRLLSVPILALNLTDVYNRRPKSGATFPYLVVSLITSTQELNTGPDYQDIPQLQFTVLSNSDTQAESLGLAAFDALMPSAANPPLKWNDGAETIRLPMFKDRLMLMPGLDKNNQPVWSYVFGYQILTVRNR